jgi:hypothetical protein
VPRSVAFASAHYRGAVTIRRARVGEFAYGTQTERSLPARRRHQLIRSKWWSIGWGVAAVAFALHVAALTLAPISIGEAVLAGVSSSSRCSPSASSASSSAVASGSGSAWSRSH